MPALWLISGAGTTSRPSIYNRTPFQGYSRVDYLDRMIPTFNKSSFYYLLNSHLENDLPLRIVNFLWKITALILIRFILLL